MSPAPAERLRRQGAQRRGLRAEALAAWWLRLKGYRIVARDVRAPGGQIDIVARRGRVAAVVEVKRRDARDSAVEAVSRRQQARLAAAAASLTRWPSLAGLAIRFDVVVVTPGRLPRHIADAWRPDG